MRALFSGSWALAPGLIGLYLVSSPSMTPAYGIAALASCTCFCLYFFFAPGNGSGGPAPDPVGFFASLKRIFVPHVLSRVIVMAMLFGLQRLNAMLLPLIITHAAGGTVVDVGFMAGLTALLEMPFMMMWGFAQRRFRTVHVLAFGALIYCVYLLLLGFASAPWHVYALLLFNACGAAAILSVPITYLQDLIADRPGLGTSLISLTRSLGLASAPASSPSAPRSPIIPAPPSSARPRVSHRSECCSISKAAGGGRGNRREVRRSDRQASTRRDAIGAAAGAGEDVFAALDLSTEDGAEGFEFGAAEAGAGGGGRTDRAVVFDQHE